MAEPPPASATKRLRGYAIRPMLLASALILTLGAVQDVFGNTDTGDVYGSDAVQYLDIARALAHQDWHSALNPLWSPGYSAGLAVVHLLFPHGPQGDWWTTRAANYLIFAFSYAAFLYLLLTTVPRLAGSDPQKRGARLRRVFGCFILFVAVQICLGQVSRIGPDELVTGLFLFASAQIVRLTSPTVVELRRPWLQALLLGLTFGIGFLVKAAFLPLGCGMLLLTGIALRRRRARLQPVFIAAAVFAVITGLYGAALSRAVGHRTLGEAGSLNYAWHVDRLQKWVHWEGGVQPANEAWPKPFIARLAQWDTRPPNFGTPVHPSAILQRSPRVYGFAAPVHATYVPYFDPPYFYQGFHPVFGVRYQLIALTKSCSDLLLVLMKQPIAWALALSLVLLLRIEPVRSAFVAWFRGHWLLAACGVFGILLYLPVHLEGRYIAGMLLVLGTCCILAATETDAGTTSRTAAAIFLLGFAAELAIYQSPVWRNLLHARSPTQNIEWRMGTAALGQNLPLGAPVGVIAWTPSLHCDWAYIAHLQITSEIASGQDYDQFWHLPPDQQAMTLATFRRAGDVAVFVEDKPLGLGGPEWKQLSGTPLWMARLQ